MGFAGSMFMCLLAHGVLVIVWQVRLPKQQRVFGCLSLVLKICIATLAVFSILGVVPLVALFLCPDSVCDPRVELDNLGGLSQRAIVMCIILFLASYALDIRTMQKQDIASEVSMAAMGATASTELEATV